MPIRRAFQGGIVNKPIPRAPSSGSSASTVPDDRKRSVANADLAAVDRLCRMQLEAHRLGCQIILGDGDEQLQDLMAFVGIDDLFDPLPSADVKQPTRGSAGERGGIEMGDAGAGPMSAASAIRHATACPARPFNPGPSLRDGRADPRATRRAPSGGHARAGAVSGPIGRSRCRHARASARQRIAGRRHSIVVCSARAAATGGCRALRDRRNRRHRLGARPATRGRGHDVAATADRRTRRRS